MQIIRAYRSSDIGEITELFFRTVRETTAGEYTEKQRAVWAPCRPDPDIWDRELRAHHTAVVLDKGIIVGFGDIHPSGFLDRLFVHAEHQRKGIGSILCCRLEKAVPGTVTVHASLTARAFFEKRGYTVLAARTENRNGISLPYFLMEKVRRKEPAD